MAASFGTAISLSKCKIWHQNQSELEFNRVILRAQSKAWAWRIRNWLHDSFTCSVQLDNSHTATRRNATVYNSNCKHYVSYTPAAQCLARTWSLSLDFALG